MEKILLHTCCAPCLSYVYEVLKSDYHITCFFYNPNIYPADEFEKRLLELRNFCVSIGVDLVVPEYDTAVFYKSVAPLKDLGEKSERCMTCYRLRLEETAIYAARNHFDLFATVLSISPHKICSWINSAGIDLAQKHGVEFLEADFKKKDGFKKSCELSRKYGFYRQDYCGCMYSRNERNNIEKLC